MSLLIYKSFTINQLHRLAYPPPDKNLTTEQKVNSLGLHKKNNGRIFQRHTGGWLTFWQDFISSCINSLVQGGVRII